MYSLTCRLAGQSLSLFFFVYISLSLSPSFSLFPLSLILSLSHSLSLSLSLITTTGTFFCLFPCSPPPSPTRYQAVRQWGSLFNLFQFHGLLGSKQDQAPRCTRATAGLILGPVGPRQQHSPHPTPPPLIVLPPAYATTVPNADGLHWFQCELDWTLSITGRKTRTLATFLQFPSSWTEKTHKFETVPALRIWWRERC